VASGETWFYFGHPETPNREVSAGNQSGVATSYHNRRLSYSAPREGRWGREGGEEKGEEKGEEEGN